MGLLHCADDDDNRVTAVSSDVEYVRALRGASADVLGGLTIPEGMFDRRCDGWPDDWL